MGAFKEITSLDADTTISIGGFNKKTRKDNPTQAEGYYLGTRKVSSPKSKDGTASIHFLKTPKGNLGVWGKTDMDRKMTQVKPGTMIRISFDRMVPTPNGEMYKFKVAVDESNVDDTIEAYVEQPVVLSAVDEGSNVVDDSQAGEEDEEDNYEAEETAQKAALSQAERQAKVQALLKNRKK